MTADNHFGIGAARAMRANMSADIERACIGGDATDEGSALPKYIMLKPSEPEVEPDAD